MTARPDFFQRIRENASRRWDQLEQDPELAGPWHQLFAQVQSPRHVLSELLQNADDAGATEASVGIEGSTFVFSHNGEDFAEEHFASLCRFGYSNKRALHTIGFRGIGFKSTFSLGDAVELITPTLSVAFDRRRFTEPSWIEHGTRSDGRTLVRVPIKDEQRKLEIEKNLHEWMKSPLSLVFFKHIRRLEIEDSVVEWTHLRPGPVAGTEWMALNGKEEDAYLIARSDPEPFPAEALNEIRNERLLSAEQEMDFPPCRVEIVLGAAGRLYVVLPTGVQTDLPFACNAPFIQDPARFKIKAPETSPTNRWLLRRAGELAASVMLKWLATEDLDVHERARAYALLPKPGQDEGATLEDYCGGIVRAAVDETVGERAILLTDPGDLVPPRAAVAVPPELLDVWPQELVSRFFDLKKRPPLSRHIAPSELGNLIAWSMVSSISRDSALQVLQTHHLPRPRTWASLLNLWGYVENATQSYQLRALQPKLRIVPVMGKDELFAASEVIRLGERKLLQSETDSAFLGEYLLAMDPTWVRWLAARRGNGSEGAASEISPAIPRALALMDRVGLGDTSEIGKIMEQVTTAFFKRKPIDLRACIRLVQISAKLNVHAGKALRFVTRDKQLKSTESTVIFDPDGSVEQVLPHAWCEAHLLHQDYIRTFSSCTADEWHRWIASNRSGLAGFVPMRNLSTAIANRHAVEWEIKERGGSSKPQFHYVTHRFRVEDWDFEKDLWEHWRRMATENPKIWGRVVSLIMRQPEGFWSRAVNARISQESTSGTTRYVTGEHLAPTWILKLRELPCLPDTRGFFHKPSDLLRRTPETEPFIDVEPFVDVSLDRESTRTLLTLLGVRDAPTGPANLLDRLRALAKAEKPPVQEVEKWYRRLDQMLEHASTADLATVREAFQLEAIILAEDGTWQSTPAVFLAADEEDVPGAAIVRIEVRDLALWVKIGVAARPTAELALQWLQNLPSGLALSADDQRRVRALLARHASRVWNECGHWINLANEWVPVESLHYCVAMRSLIPWEHLHDWVKQQTADLRRLPIEVLGSAPFTSLQTLSEYVEDRFHRVPSAAESARPCAWLNAFGRTLARIRLESEEHTARVRILAEALGLTQIQVTPGLEIIPYIKGVPAGLPRHTEVLWRDKVLYVETLPAAKLAKLVPDVLGKHFGEPSIASAFAYCYGRPVADVVEYLTENFDLEPEATPQPTGNSPQPAQPPKEAPDGATTDDPTSSVSGAQISEVEEGAPPGIPSGSGTDPIEDAGPEEEVASPVVDLKPSPPAPKPPPKPPKPDIIERFVIALGYKRHGPNLFVHASGSRIVKAEHGSLFGWERQGRSGDVLKRYWARDHCLETEPLQLDAAVWSMIDSHPETHALILADAFGTPVEISGADLVRMQRNGQLNLYPATYRIVLKHDEHATS